MRTVYACAKMLEAQRSTARASGGETGAADPASRNAGVGVPGARATEVLR
jgi:hypothetical protein